MLGDAAANYPNAIINLCIKQATAEIKAYCNRDIDEDLETIVERVAVIKLNRMNSEGLASQGYSGISENYIDGYPQDIMAVLNSKRKLKVV